MAFSDYLYGANTGMSMAQRASGMSKKVAIQGRQGDRNLIHATPFTKELLKAIGGAGTTNPKTGLMEFYPKFEKIKL